jgi:hypothetical protein
VDIGTEQIGPGNPKSGGFSDGKAIIRNLTNWAGGVFYNAVTVAPKSARPGSEFFPCPSQARVPCARISRTHVVPLGMDKALTSLCSRPMRRRWCFVSSTPTERQNWSGSNSRSILINSFTDGLGISALAKCTDTASGALRTGEGTPVQSEQAGVRSLRARTHRRTWVGSGHIRNGEL